MPDVINEYQKWKQQGEDLRVQAKHAMETRFRDLLCEAVHIAEEYRTDFGAVLKPPPAVTAFRSEEHTSELQSLRHLVCRLLLEKTKKQKNKHTHTHRVSIATSAVSHHNSM